MPVNHELHPQLSLHSDNVGLRTQIHTNGVDSSLEADSYQSVANEIVKVDFSQSNLAGNSAFTTHDPTNNVVSLTEESVPVIEYLFLFIIQIFPFWPTVFQFERALCKCPR